MGYFDVNCLGCGAQMSVHTGHEVPDFCLDCLGDNGDPNEADLVRQYGMSPKAAREWLRKTELSKLDLEKESSSENG